jgi:stearoyl-CoA desaturase (delta-9 desaturase)
MPPRNVDVDLLSGAEVKENEVEPVVTEETTEQKRPPLKFVWRNIVLFSFLHLAALYGMFLLPWAKPQTWLFTFMMYIMGALGITAGAHRLWAHRSYKAKLPLRILLAFFNSMAFQNDIIEWSRDHRAHHKYSETDADPHNAKRGFFFAHMGWLLVRKHPDVKAKGKQIDLSDLMRDPVCQIQRKVYLPSVVLLVFVMPTMVPVYFWGESAWAAYFIAIFRLILALNITWLVNSAAHTWGNKPYDKFINPSENFFVTFGAIGEGFHNYHHTFPHDYSTSEFGWRFNLTTFFIDTMKKIGWAYDCKKMSHEAVFRRKERTGDGSEGFNHFSFSGAKTVKTK